jgi:antirestriction protein ArdC
MNHDLYQVVTDRIVAALEAGTAPWIKPWAADFDGVPVNAGSKRPYRGVNRVLLTMEALARGYRRNAWLTYRQAKELGGQVRGGERGTTIVFYRLREAPQALEDERSENEPKPKVIPLLRAYTVFSVQQVDGLPDRLNPPAPSRPAWAPHEAAERLLHASGARIEHGGSYAFYSPLDDRIVIPDVGAFKDRGSYYATALHELTHWTGHPDRLDRQLGRRFADAVYAAEELVAEMGGAFLCASCHLDGKLQHAEYIGEWLKVLKNDKRAIFTASTKAQQAADYIESKVGSPPEERAAAEEAA